MVRRQFEIIMDRKRPVKSDLPPFSDDPCYLGVGRGAGDGGALLPLTESWQGRQVGREAWRGHVCLIAGTPAGDSPVSLLSNLLD